jgi:hypothetical protein
MNDNIPKTGNVPAGAASESAWRPAEGQSLGDLGPIVRRGADHVRATLAGSFLLLLSDLDTPDGPMRTRDKRSEAEASIGARSLVIPIRRKPTSTMAFVSIGRLEGNDVVIADVSVSKFHAYIKTAGGVDTIIDAGSRNGTSVDNVKAPRQREGLPIVLSSGARLRFGTVHMTYISADTLVALVEQLRR